MANLDPLETPTSKEQQEVEGFVVQCYQQFLVHATTDAQIRLEREKHVAWLTKALQTLSRNFSGLDASRPWFVFWITHALELLGATAAALRDGDAVPSFLKRCENARTGGLGGGPLQLAHLAPTYAGVTALLVNGGAAAYECLDRQALYGFIMRMKDPCGGFRMHDMGELDMRGTYCAIAVASMLHILSDEMIEGVADYVATCQQWDGALPGEAGLESHGGYTYCGLAALCILGEEHKLDLEALLDWLVHRQMTAEGGFQGRTNKLVDSCYTFWQGAIANLLHNSMGDRAPADHMWISSVPLQMYVLLACQSVQGGLRDKPGKSPDYYHTCYSLSGVAASQAKGDLCGSPENMLVPTSVYYNCSEGKAREARRYFADHPITVGGQTGREGAGVVLHEETRRSDPVPPTRPPAVAGRGYPS